MNTAVSEMLWTVLHLWQYVEKIFPSFFQRHRSVLFWTDPSKQLFFCNHGSNAWNSLLLSHKSFANVNATAIVSLTVPGGYEFYYAAQVKNFSFTFVFQFCISKKKSYGVVFKYWTYSDTVKTQAGETANMKILTAGRTNE